MERAARDREKYQLLAVARRSPSKKIRHNRIHPELASNVATLVFWQRTALYLTCGQDPTQTVDRQDTEG